MKPNFEDGYPFSKKLFAVETRKTKIKLNNPVFLGEAILDLGKMLMYKFQYDCMQPKYGSEVKLCYMDTESFVYEIGTKDFYRDFAKDVEIKFDASRRLKDDADLYQQEGTRTLQT